MYAEDKTAQGVTYRTGWERLQDVTLGRPQEVIFQPLKDVSRGRPQDVSRGHLLTLHRGPYVDVHRTPLDVLMASSERNFAK